jgi:hypothetical protein
MDQYLRGHVPFAAYGTLLREPRRALHVRIVEGLESQFTEIAESQPELLARHCTEAGHIEKAARLWGKAGQRSLARSALVEAVAQLSRALDQIASLPSTPPLRREQIRSQVALITPLLHVKGYSAPEAKAAVERARLLIERAEAQQKRKRISSAPWPSHVSNKQNPGNCAQRRAWRGCGAIRANDSKPTIFSPQSTAGSLRASIRST